MRSTVEVFAEFVVSFFRSGGAERSQHPAVELIPDFGKMLKTDRSTSIAITVFEAHQKLLNHSPIVFADNEVVQRSI